MSFLRKIGHAIPLLMWLFVCYLTFMKVRHLILTELIGGNIPRQFETMFYLETFALLLVSILGLLSYVIFRPTVSPDHRNRQVLRIFANTTILFVFHISIIWNLLWVFAGPLFGTALAQVILLFLSSPTQGVGAIEALSDLVMILNGFDFWVVLAGICTGLLRMLLKKGWLYSVLTFVVGYTLLVIFVSTSFYAQKGNWFPTQVSNDNFLGDGVIESPYNEDDRNYVNSIAYSKDGHLFVGGSGPDGGWRLEKRDAISGKPDRDFGSRGFIAGDPETLLVDHILIDNNRQSLYTRINMSLRTDASDRIEKRNLEDGELDLTFGHGGFVEDAYSMLLMDKDTLYSLKQEKYWRKISDSSDVKHGDKKITLTVIDKDTGKKSPEIILNATAKLFTIEDAAIDGKYLYILLHESGTRSTDEYLVFEKRNLQTGKLINNFGNEGVVRIDIEYRGHPKHLVLDNNFLYAVDNFFPEGDKRKNGTSPKNMLRVKKLSLSSGQPDISFGENGSVLIDPNGSRSSLIDMLLLNDHLYIIGSERNTLDIDGESWRTKIYKVATDSSEIDTQFDTAPTHNSALRGPIGAFTKSHLILVDDSWGLERRRISDGALE
jgi:hypothetical protein